MKPMKVDVGEFAPDVDELIEKANNMDEMLTKIASLRDDSQLRNITGVEEAQMTHYWTNQYQPEEDIESVQRQNPSVESVNLIDAIQPSKRHNVTTLMEESRKHHQWVVLNHQWVAVAETMLQCSLL